MSVYDDVGREALHDWLDERGADDARLEARQDAAYDDFLDRAATCADCGELWDPGYHRATRTDPAYEEMPECPYCGGERTES